MKRHIEIKNDLIDRCEKHNMQLEQATNNALRLYLMIFEEMALLQTKGVNVSPKKSKLSASDFTGLTQSETKPVYDTKKKESTNTVPMLDIFSDDYIDDEVDDIPF